LWVSTFDKAEDGEDEVVDNPLLTLELEEEEEEEDENDSD